MPVSLAWISGSLSAGQLFVSALSWITQNNGPNVVNLYLFDSITNLELLANPLALSFSLNSPIQEITKDFDSSTSSQSNSLTLSLNDDSLSTGDELVISGKVPNLDENVIGVTAKIKDPHGNFVYVSATDVSNSNYNFSFKTGGLMKLTGDYEIEINYGSIKNTKNFHFTAIDDLHPIPQPEPTQVPRYNGIRATCNECEINWQES